MSRFYFIIGSCFLQLASLFSLGRLRQLVGSNDQQWIGSCIKSMNLNFMLSLLPVNPNLKPIKVLPLISNYRKLLKSDFGRKNDQAHFPQSWGIQPTVLSFWSLTCWWECDYVVPQDTHKVSWKSLFGITNFFFTPHLRLKESGWRVWWAQLWGTGLLLRISCLLHYPETSFD